MGQAPSIAELPPEWEEILPNVTKEDILRSSRKKCKVVGEAKSVYLDSDIFDLDEHVPMALAILRAHPHLKDIRFKLVPGRMTEERYWAALFGTFHFNLTYHNFSLVHMMCSQIEYHHRYLERWWT